MTNHVTLRAIVSNNFLAIVFTRFHLRGQLGVEGTKEPAMSPEIIIKQNLQIRTFFCLALSLISSQ